MKLHAPIKGIFFDVGWTLLRPVNEDFFINNKIMEYVDTKLFEAIPQGKKTAAFYRASKYLADNHLVLSEDEELKQFEVFYSMLAEDLPELALTKEQISEIAYSKVYEMGNYIFFDDTVATLEALSGKYKLGVISDTWPSIEQMLCHGNIEHFFETKTFSCFLGTYKPDKGMYLHALEQMKLPPEQTVFIDDSVENLEGAEKCGIQPVLITAKPDAESSDKYPSIKKLSKLLELLPE